VCICRFGCAKISPVEVTYCSTPLSTDSLPKCHPLPFGAHHTPQHKTHDIPCMPCFPLTTINMQRSQHAAAPPGQLYPPAAAAAVPPGLHCTHTLQSQHRPTPRKHPLDECPILVCVLTAAVPDSICPSVLQYMPTSSCVSQCKATIVLSRGAWLHTNKTHGTAPGYAAAGAAMETSSATRSQARASSASRMPSSSGGLPPASRSCSTGCGYGTSGAPACAAHPAAPRQDPE